MTPSGPNDPTPTSERATTIEPPVNTTASDNDSVATATSNDATTATERATTPETKAASETTATVTTQGTSTTGNKPRSPLWWWVLGIACVLGVELFIYGHNGWVRVCVGKEGV